jgi:tRNA (uracil-5-)-methyltransferase
MEFRIKKILPNLEGEIEYKQKKYSAPFVVPGDIVHFKIKRFGRKTKLIVKDIIKQDISLDYVIPPKCKHFGECGGCKAQHLNYSYQWYLKTNGLKNLYQNSFLIAIKEIPSVNIFHYRNRMDFLVSDDCVGLRKPHRFDEFVDIEYCHIQKEEANIILNIFRNIIKKYKNLGYNRKTNTGVIKYITIRIGIDGMIIFTLLKDYDKQEDLKILYNNFIDEFINNIKQLESRINFSFSVKECYVDEKAEISNVSNGKIVYNHSYLKIPFGELVFNVPADGFFQPNPEIISKMLDNAIEDFLKHEQNGKYQLIDLYCGSGILSIYLTRKLNQSILTSVMGIEIIENAIELAKKNFEYFFGDQIPYNFITADLNKIKEIPINNASILILDPPRSGLHPKIIEWIINTPQIKWIFYLSCNPPKQYEEMQKIKSIFDVESIIFGDPFPHTSHWESLILLKRKV